MKRLYMSDLDGTLAQNSIISDYTKSTLNALIKRGLQFTINTSRTPKSIAPVIEGLELNLPIILMNGAMVYDTVAKTVVAKNYLKKTATRAVCAKANILGLEPFVFSAEDDDDVNVYFKTSKSPQNRRFVSERKNYYKAFKNCKDFDFMNVPYIVIVGELSKLKRLSTMLSFIGDISYSLFLGDGDDYCFLEVYSSFAGKKQSAERFKKDYGFDSLYAYGDNLNDIELLKYADIGFAVANGFDAVKNAANEVIGTVEDDAVAKHILIEWSRQMDVY